MKKILILFWSLSPIWLAAQAALPTTIVDSLPQETVFHYLKQDGLLRVHFFGHLDKLNKYEEEKEKHKAKMIVLNAPSKKTSWKVKLEQRGKLRKDICKVKPLRIDFSKKQLKKRELAPLDKVKMVLPCDKGKKANQRVLKEYLAYRLYNLLTDKSYQVQLVEAVFEDSLSTKNYTVNGFILEPTKALGFRNKAHISESRDKSLENLVEKDYLIFSVFQYLIGNPDWNIALSHNVKFLEPPGKEKSSPIPYDFDFSGLVNAPYATPDTNLPIDKVTDRLFMGSYKDKALLKEVVQLFHGKKKQMKDMVLGFQYLEEKERRMIWTYLDKFFKETQNWDNLHHVLPKETRYQEVMELEKRKG